MATWMSIGGSHDYSTNQHKSSNRRISDKLKNLPRIDASTRSRLLS